MFRTFALIYGLANYALFLLVSIYAVGFVGGFGTPTTLAGPRSESFASALMIDGLLIGLFGLQHSVMARPGFKRWWTRLVPEPLECAAPTCRPAPRPTVLAMAPAGDHGLGDRAAFAARCTLDDLYRGLARRGGCEPSHQPLRSVRLATGVALLSGTALSPSAVLHSGPLSAGSAPALCRVAHRVLVYAEHVAGAVGFCSGNDGLHLDRHSI